MPSGYKRQHLRVDHFVDLKPYRRPNQMVPARDLGRETERHAESLKRELAEAWADADGLFAARDADGVGRSEEHTSGLQSLMRISYAVFCLKKKNFHIILFIP